MKRYFYIITQTLNFTCFIFLFLICIYNPDVTKTRSTWAADHISHISTVPIFLKHGFEIYNTPTEKFCPESLHINSHMKCDKNIWINWQLFPRVYPPLNLLLHFPSGLALNYGIELKFVALSTVFIYLVGALIFNSWLSKLCFEKSELHPIVLLCLWGQVSSLVWYHTSEGFYDIFPIMLVSFSLVNLLTKSSPINGLLFYSLAVGLHFRMLWYLPLGCIHLFNFLKQKDFSNKIKIFTILIISILTIYTFILVYPYLESFPLTNLYYWKNPSSIYFVISLILIFIWSLYAYFKKLKYYYILIPVFVFLFTIMVRQTMRWHSLSLIPLCLFPIFSLKRDGLFLAVVFSLLYYFWFYRGFYFNI